MRKSSVKSFDRKAFQKNDFFNGFPSEIVGFLTMILEPIVEILTMYYFEAVETCSKFLKLALAVAGLVFFASCGKKTQTRGAEAEILGAVEKIVGGSEVASSTLVNNIFVMIVSDNNGTPQVCTGTFISSRHILTAAHCVNETVDDLSLVTGVKPLGDEQALILIPIHIDRHEKYNASSKMERNDIAIITVAESIGLDPHEIPQLPSLELAAKIEEVKNLQFLAVGYGKTGTTANLERSEGILRSVKLRTDFKNEKILMVNQTNGHGVCYGDSGGPALKLYRGTHYVIGVASGIYNEGLSQQIDECQGGSLYMNIIPHIKWIQDIIYK